MLKRLLALLLVGVMLIGTFAMTSCADDTDDTPDDSTTDVTDEEEEEEEEKEEERLPIILPDKKYGSNGEPTEIHFIEWSANGHTTIGETWLPWAEVDIPEWDGDILNNAIYDRNKLVEETYDVTITQEYVSVDQGFLQNIMNNATSGDNAYQVMTMRSVNIAAYVFGEYMLNMFDLEYLNTDMPWWNQDSVRSYTLGSNLYFAAPEMLLRDKGGTACMFYNTKVASDYGIDDLYAVVDNGDWTQDAMIEYCEQVMADLGGGEGIDSYEDMWGALGADDPVYYLFNGAGLKFAHIDDDGYIEYDFGDEESITVLKDIFDYIIYADWYGVGYSPDETDMRTADVFTADHALFSFNCVKGVLGLRNMESKYGILPIPKLDESQENYSSLVWVHHDCVLGILAAVPEGDREMVSVVLEYMNYLSYYTVFPSFYDTVLLTKSTHDEESKRMLEIVFETRSFDPGQYWDNGTGLHGGDGYLRLQSKGTSDIASIWAKWEDAVYKCFDELNEKIVDME